MLRTFDRKTRLAVVATCLLVVIYLVDSRTEVLILEDTSLPVGMRKPGRRKTYGEFVKAAGMNPRYPIGIPYVNYPDMELPTYLKYRESMLTDVVNQDQCTSCWAISVCHVIADRISLYTGGRIRRPLSHQELVSCFNVRGDLGCTVGGIPEQAYEYIAEHGIATEEDYPYVQAGTTRIARCDPGKKKGFRTYIQKNSTRSLCVDPSIHEKGSADWQKVVDQNIRNMRTELFLNGPINVTVFVYSSMYEYDGLRIFDPEEKDLGAYVGGHAAVCFGMAEEVNGEEPGFDNWYWLVKNSWSTSWPLKSPASKGYMYIRAGKNVCGIESRASTCQILITDEIKKNMVSSLDESRYLSYTDYVNDPQRQLYITKATRLRSMLV
ncbi:unnamed protein product [Pylaiella littoralis]